MGGSFAVESVAGLLWNTQNYEQLSNLLTVANWKGADAETSRLLREAAGIQQGEGIVVIGDADGWVTATRPSCEDLLIIDRLWVKYSGGRFGLSAQKNAYQNAGGNPNSNKLDERVWQRFLLTVGWMSDWKQDPYTDIDSAPRGHLPRQYLNSSSGEGYVINGSHSQAAAFLDYFWSCLEGFLLPDEAPRGWDFWDI